MPVYYSRRFSGRDKEHGAELASRMQINQVSYLQGRQSHCWNAGSHTLSALIISDIRGPKIFVSILFLIISPSCCSSSSGSALVSDLCCRCPPVSAGTASDASSPLRILEAGGGCGGRGAAAPSSLCQPGEQDARPEPLMTEQRL